MKLFFNLFDLVMAPVRVATLYWGDGDSDGDGDDGGWGGDDGDGGWGDDDSDGGGWDGGWDSFDGADFDSIDASDGIAGLSSDGLGGNDFEAKGVGGVRSYNYSTTSSDGVAAAQAAAVEAVTKARVDAVSSAAKKLGLGAVAFGLAGYPALAAVSGLLARGWNALSAQQQAAVVNAFNETGDDADAALHSLGVTPQSDGLTTGGEVTYTFSEEIASPAVLNAPRGYEQYDFSSMTPEELAGFSARLDVDDYLFNRDLLLGTPGNTDLPQYLRDKGGMLGLQVSQLERQNTLDEYQSNLYLSDEEKTRRRNIRTDQYNAARDMGTSVRNYATRANEVFTPDLIDANRYVASARSQALADADAGIAASRRDMQRMGINPASGRYGASMRTAQLGAFAGASAAANKARDFVTQENYKRKMDARDKGFTALSNAVTLQSSLAGNYGTATPTLGLSVNPMMPTAPSLSGAINAQNSALDRQQTADTANKDRTQQAWSSGLTLLTSPYNADGDTGLSYLLGG